MKYVCELCGMIYDEASGDPKHKIPEGTLFTDLPSDYTCPICGCEKETFVQIGSGASVKPENDTKYHSQR